MEYPGFIGGSYESQAVTADQEDTMNWYVEKMESQGSTSRSALYPTPGVTELSAAASGPGRAHFAQNGREFAVIGTTFYEIGMFGALTSRGTVAIGADPATICSNGDGGGQLMVTSGTNVYIYDLLADTLTQVVSMDGKATMGDQLDGYFIVIDGPNSTFYISDLLDGTTWDPTQFAQRSIAADPWIAMKVADRYIWLFGEQTSEVWYDKGTSPFPFEPYPGVLLPYGIAAPFSATVAEGSLIWVGASALGDGYVLRAAGFTPEVISTMPLQKELNGYSEIGDAIADSYNDLGHTFYRVNFPTANHTWAWDTQTQVWARRGTWIEEEGEYDAWRPMWHAFAFNEHRMLDSSTGSLYLMSPDIATDVDSRVIRRYRRAPCLLFENERITYSAFEVDLEPGLGLNTGQGSDPQVMMRQSNDGGKTWGSERWVTAGAMGNYATRVRWPRCGQARRRVFEVVVTDPIVNWRLTASYLTLSNVPRGMQQQRGAA